MRFQTLAEWLAWQETLHPQAIDLGLGRVKSVLERMDLEAKAPFTITVGGTNGKGSCVAMLDSIFRASGYRVGTYTSPHILKYNERICIDGHPVGDERIIQSFDRIDRLRGDNSLSFFEFGTLTALDIFNDEPLDVRILEVGLGGRLDAVNAITADVALVASIDIDHREWLGDTREKIGAEKAGIFRSGQVAVLGDPDVPCSVVAIAEQQGAKLSVLGKDFGYEHGGLSWTWFHGGRVLKDLPVPSIPGAHQFMNASAVLEVLNGSFAKRPVDEKAIRSGLSNVKLSGRFQFFPGTVPVLLDVAHNPQAVRMLKAYLLERFSESRIHAVFSVMRDKDIAEIIYEIKDQVDDWYLAPLKMTRAAQPEDLAKMMRKGGVGQVYSGFNNVMEAVDAAKNSARSGDLVLVFGSFFLVSEFLANAV